MRSKVSFQRWNGFGILLCFEAGKTPVAIQAKQAGIPRGGLFKKFGSFGKFRILCAHNAQVVVRAGKNFRCELVIHARGLGFLGLWNCWLRPNGWSFRRGSLCYRFCGFLLVLAARFEQAGDAIGGAAVAVSRNFGLVENVLGVVAKLRFAIAL